MIFPVQRGDIDIMPGYGRYNTGCGGRPKALPPPLNLHCFYKKLFFVLVVVSNVINVIKCGKYINKKLNH